MTARNKAGHEAALVILALFTLLLFSGCGGKEPIKIGFIAGMTGPSSELGVTGRQGAMIAVDEVNAAGGVKGRKVEIVFKDV